MQEVSITNAVETEGIIDLAGVLEGHILFNVVLYVE